MWNRSRLRGGTDERGAALVEFALILPIFMTLVLGLFSGGIAYSTKLSLNGASREGGRYGATLPVGTASCSGSTEMDRWLRCVADATVQAASGDLDEGKENRFVCVAYVYPNGAAATDRTRSLTLSGSTSTTSTSHCFTDGQTPDVRRVQVQVRRTAALETLFVSRDLTLSSKSITRFEAT